MFLQFTFTATVFHWLAAFGYQNIFTNEIKDIPKKPLFHQSQNLKPSSETPKKWHFFDKISGELQQLNGRFLNGS